jgi:DNA-binding transcriptional regulator LsrR (DeoR family)
VTEPWKLEDKVGADVIARIRAEYVPRVVTHKDLAARYGISQKSVQRILREKR